MDVEEFQAWLAQAPTGTTLVYHIGFLARDRKDDGEFHPAIPGLDELANAILDAAEYGEVAIFQKRLAEFRFEYIAMKTPPAQPKLQREAA